MTLTLLIDADTFVYEAARSVEVETQWSPTLWTLHSEMDPAIAHLDDRIHDLKAKLEADAVVMTLSNYTDPWRKRVMPTYKSNRKDVRKPIVYEPLRQYVHETYTTYQRPGLEGDDVLGVLLTHPTIIEGDKILVSLDKDMKTLPGEHYNFQKDVRFSVCEDDADYNHMLQSLSGDTTDGYPGCPGIGRVTAERILKNPQLWGETNAYFDVALAWQAVVMAYEKKGLSEDVALTNARVARICRHTDYDFKTKEVRLWEPPQAAA